MQLQSTASAQRVHPGAGHRFIRRTIPAAIAAGLVAIAGLSLSGPLAASNGERPGECNLGTLRGRYLFANNGILLPPAPGVPVARATRLAARVASIREKPGVPAAQSV